MPPQPSNGLFHIATTEYTVTGSRGESPLCSVCREVLIMLSTAYRDIITDISVERRARDGCYLCLLVQYRFHDDRHSSFLTRRGPKFVVRYRRIPNFVIQVTQSRDDGGTAICYQLESPEWVSQHTLVVAVPSRGSLFSTQTATITPTPILTPNQSLHAARLWLQRCNLQHRSCRVMALNFLPTRLVDVGTNSRPILRLALRDSVTSRAQYVTLSHCWGEMKSMPVVLTVENLSSMMQSMDFEELPKTFKDAIKVTRSLGLRYLWIDSLCIIQNSREDWEKESALMCQVYSNGFCNISAAAAKNCWDGLFFDRDPVETRAVNVLLSHSNAIPAMYTVYGRNIWEKDVDISPLNRRGWVLQERLLSRRNLHFSQAQLFWECCESTACELFPEAMPNSTGGERPNETLKTTFSEFSNCIERNGGEMPPTEFRKLWDRLVKAFSSCSLTFGTDKLIAFGGLAARIEEVYGGRYYAGIWKNDLVKQLCWSRDHMNGFERQLSQLPMSPHDTQTLGAYVAPSWSWASCPYPVTHIFWPLYSDESETTYFLTVLDVHVDLATVNTYGQVTGGHLLLQGNLGKLEYSEGEFTICRKLNPVQLYNNDLSLVWDEHGDDWAFAEGTILYTMPVALIREVNKQEQLLTGIVLKLNGTDPVTFQRCGQFTSYTEEVSTLLRAEWEQFDEAFMEPYISLQACASDTCGRLYSIKIV